MRSATLLVSPFLLACTAVAPAADRPSASPTVSVAGSQPAAKGPAEYFTGNPRVDPLFAAKDQVRETRIDATSTGVVQTTHA